MGVKCFLLVETDKVQRRLRRYVHSDKEVCTGSGIGYHNASTFLDVVPAERREGGYIKASGDWPRDDPRWPKACACGRAFVDTDEWQLSIDGLWRHADTGEEMTLRAAPPGAMWDAWWMYRGDDRKFARTGPDGRYLIVRCPGGQDWGIDSRASNCTLKDDDTHRCWVRHGEPPNLTVDKNGVTCAAGAGSIQTGNWHGFLRNGELVE